METFINTVNEFLNELSHFKGKSPIFSINYQNSELLLVDAASGFIKQLAENDRWLLSLSAKGISISRFKSK